MSSILIARSTQNPLSDAEGFLYGADIKPSTRQLVAVVRQFAKQILAVGSRLRETAKSLIAQTKNRSYQTVCLFRWWAVNKRVRGNLLPSFAFASANLAVGFPLAGNGKISYRPNQKPQLPNGVPFPVAGG